MKASHLISRKSLIVAVAAATATLTSSVDACFCPPTSVHSSYRRDYVDTVLRVTITEEVWEDGCDPNHDTSCPRMYMAVAEKTFKGCPPEGPEIRITTASNREICGVRFQLQKTYLLFATLAEIGHEFNTYSVSYCDLNKTWQSTTPEEREFLYTRGSECDGVPYCTSGANDALNRNCPLTCPSCAFDDPTGRISCEVSLCRGCWLEGAELFDTMTLENLVGCPPDDSSDAEYIAAKRAKKRTTCSCDPHVNYVCGVNKQTYSNPCFASCAGVEADYSGHCSEE